MMVHKLPGSLEHKLLALVELVVVVVEVVVVVAVVVVVEVVVVVAVEGQLEQVALGRTTFGHMLA